MTKFKNFNSPEYFILVDIFNSLFIDKYIANIIEEYIYGTVEKSLIRINYSYITLHGKVNYGTRFGIKHGTYKEWNNERRSYLEKQCNYDNGTLHGSYFIYYYPYTDPEPKYYITQSKKYYKEQCYIYSNYKFGELHGKQIMYYTNGQIEKIAHYENGYLQGEKKTFYETDDCTSILESISFYDRNELHGDYFEYWRNGNIKIYYHHYQLRNFYRNFVRLNCFEN